MKSKSNTSNQMAIDTKHKKQYNFEKRRDGGWMGRERKEGEGKERRREGVNERKRDREC